MNPVPRCQVRAIIRLYDPTDGKIIFDGHDISGKLSKEDEAYLFQNLQMKNLRMWEVSLPFLAYVPPSIQILIPVIIYLQLQFLQIPPLFSHFDTNA